MDATTYKHCSFLLSALFVLNSLAKASPPGLWLFNSDTKLHWLYSKMIRFGKCHGGAVAKNSRGTKDVKPLKKMVCFCFVGISHDVMRWFCGSVVLLALNLSGTFVFCDFECKSTSKFRPFQFVDILQPSLEKPASRKIPAFFCFLGRMNDSSC